MEKDQEKFNAAKRAIEYLEEGMIVGLGTGSTAALVVAEIGKLVADGMEILGVATSFQTEKLAQKYHIPLLSPEVAEKIDLTIDGADEFDPYLQLIKGGGGALLREKIIAYHSEVNIIVADSSKSVSRLGAFRLPVETIPFATSLISDVLKDAGLDPRQRMKEDQHPFVTDEGNYILDLDIQHITNMTSLENELLHIPGIVETGLFLNTTDIIIVGRGEDVEVIERE